MRKLLVLFVVIFVAGFLWAGWRSGALEKAVHGPADYPIVPVAFTAVHPADGFWKSRIDTNREVTIRFALAQNEITGRLDNFLKAAGRKEGTYQGERYNDTDVYKVLEGAAYSLAIAPDPELERYLDEVIEAIAAAQEDDGYLFTPRTAPSDEPPGGIGPERWSNLAVSHELYNAGHLYEAAVAHYTATGKRSLLEVAIRNADLVYATFGPDKLHAAPGHEVIEMGLVKLYRATGDTRYLELARFFLDQRGRELQLQQYPEGSRFAIYNDPVQIQAHAPVTEQTEAVGHAVRAMYLYSGMADVAALTGDVDYVGAMRTLWNDVVGTKLYLTGAIGAHHDRERFGDPYELPNLTGYGETCASIGLVFWSWRLFLLHGDAAYLDVLERVLYNGLLAGVSLEGDRFFYPNPLASDGDTHFNKGAATRQPWFGVACCPGNVTRFLPALPGYLYAVRDDQLYVANYLASEATFELGGQPLTLVQQTDYPWQGSVRITVEPLAPTALSLRLRIPGWAADRPVPSDLYEYLPAASGDPRLRVNGVPVELTLEAGFAVLDRVWSPGDVIELELPMPVRRVLANPAVAEDRGKVALERGPLVYAVEGADNGGHALDLLLADDAPVSVARRDDLPGAPLALTAPAALAGGGELELTAIPYFAWSHRGPGPMAVWLQRRE